MKENMFYSSLNVTSITTDTFCQEPLSTVCYTVIAYVIQINLSISGLLFCPKLRIMKNYIYLLQHYVIKLTHFPISGCLINLQIHIKLFNFFYFFLFYVSAKRTPNIHKPYFSLKYISNCYWCSSTCCFSHITLNKLALFIQAMSR